MTPIDVVNDPEEKLLAGVLPQGTAGVASAANADVDPVPIGDPDNDEGYDDDDDDDEDEDETTRSRSSAAPRTGHSPGCAVARVAARRHGSEGVSVVAPPLAKSAGRCSVQLLPRRSTRTPARMLSRA